MQCCWCGDRTIFSENGFFVQKTPLLFEDLYEDFYRNKLMLKLVVYETVHDVIYRRIILVLFGKWTVDYTGRNRNFFESGLKITRAKKLWSF